MADTEQFSEVPLSIVDNLVAEYLDWGKHAQALASFKRDTKCQSFAQTKSAEFFGLKQPPKNSPLLLHVLSQLAAKVEGVHILSPRVAIPAPRSKADDEANKDMDLILVALSSAYNKFLLINIPMLADIEKPTDEPEKGTALPALARRAQALSQLLSHLESLMGLPGGLQSDDSERPSHKITKASVVATLRRLLQRELTLSTALQSHVAGVPVDAQRVETSATVGEGGANFGYCIPMNEEESEQQRKLSDSLQHLRQASTLLQKYRVEVTPEPSPPSSPIIREAPGSSRQLVLLREFPKKENFTMEEEPRPAPRAAKPVMSDQSPPREAQAGPVPRPAATTTHSTSETRAETESPPPEPPIVAPAADPVPTQEVLDTTTQKTEKHADDKSEKSDARVVDVLKKLEAASNKLDKIEGRRGKLNNATPVLTKSFNVASKKTTDAGTPPVKSSLRVATADSNANVQSILGALQKAQSKLSEIESKRASKINSSTK